MNIILNNFNYQQNLQGIKNKNQIYGSSGKKDESFDTFENITDNAKQSERKKLITLLDNLRFFKNMENENIGNLPIETQENITKQYLKFWKKSKGIGELDEKELKAFEARYVQFKETPEGIRRAKMSDEDIAKQAGGMFSEICERLEIQKEYQPKLEISFDKTSRGGIYSPTTHTVTFYPFAYKMGIDDMELTLAHEMTHCKEALKRAAIPQDRADEIIKNQLISNIKNGEEIYTLAHSNVNEKSCIIPQLYMPENMQYDFIEFAKENLYNKSNVFRSNFEDFCINPQRRNSKRLKDIKNLSEKLEILMENYPQFQNQFKSKEEAFENLLLYSLSHTTRYQDFTDNKIGIGVSKKLPPLKIKELKGEELKKAEKSLLNYMNLVQSNTVNSLLPMDKIGKMQYKFAPEEVLADTNGCKFLIEKLNKKQNEMEENGTLTFQDKIYFELKKKQAELMIELENKGINYYENGKNLKLLKLKTKMKEMEMNELAAEYDKYTNELLNLKKA